MSIHEIVNAADNLSFDEQQTLLDILKRRVAEVRRKQLVQEVQEARDEFSKGQCQPASVQEIMKEVLS